MYRSFRNKQIVHVSFLSYDNSTLPVNIQVFSHILPESFKSSKKKNQTHKNEVGACKSDVYCTISMLSTYNI